MFDNPSVWRHITFASSPFSQTCARYVNDVDVSQAKADEMIMTTQLKTVKAKFGSLVPDLMRILLVRETFSPVNLSPALPYATSPRNRSLTRRARASLASARSRAPAAASASS